MKRAIAPTNLRNGRTMPFYFRLDSQLSPAEQIEWPAVFIHWKYFELAPLSWILSKAIILVNVWETFQIFQKLYNDNEASIPLQLRLSFSQLMKWLKNLATQSIPSKN